MPTSEASGPVGAAAGCRRVLVCTQGFPRNPEDHRSPFVLDHAYALAAAGVEVTVLCPSAAGLPLKERYPPKAAGGAPVDVVRFRYAPRRLETLAYDGAMHRRILGAAGLLLPFFFIGFAVGILRHGRRASVLHAHWWVPSGLVAVAGGRVLGVPVVVHVHGTDAAIAKGPLALLARSVLRSAEAVMAASSSLAAWVAEVSGRQATVAPMPLALERVPEPTPPPADGPVLGVGRLVPEKGFDVLVRAAALAGAPLVLVGEGTERRALEAIAARTGARVSFVGSVSPEDLAASYAAARVVAVPSRREGFGMVAAEAAAAGRAVAASAVGGLCDVVREGLTGALVAPDDPEALAATLRTLDPALGANGPQAVAWLRPEAIAARSLSVYDSLAHRRGRVRQLRAREGPPRKRRWAWPSTIRRR